MSTSLKNGMAALKAQIDTPIASFLSSCVHCGMCSEACLFYTETGDPRYTPIYKVEPLKRVWQQEYTLLGKIGKAVGLLKPITDEELEEWETLVYDGCTMCGRCSMVCPVGNDIVYMIRKLREGMVASGHAPPDLKGATERTLRIGSPMGVTPEVVRKKVAQVEKEIGMDIPVDVPNVDYLMLLSSAEVMQFYEIIGAVAKLFDYAGVSWTLSTKAYEATNSAMQIGASDLAGELVQRIVDAAEELNVKTVISPECGHAYTALRWEGPNLVGKAYSFDVKHILEVLDELRTAGKIKTVGNDDTRLTFHDPCQLVRRGGVVEQPRELLKMFASDFVEMPDAGIANWCCGGGGGVSANERAEEVRIKAFGKKKSQLEGLKVEKLVTACSNCRNVIDEGLEENQMEDIEVVGLAELLAEYLPEKAN